MRSTVVVNISLSSLVGDLTIYLPSSLSPFPNTRDRHSRFLKVFFEVGDGTNPVETTTNEKVEFIVVAADQGLLGKPTRPITEILLGPAERYEILITFKGHENKVVTLRNSEPTLVGPGAYYLFVMSGDF